MWLMHLIPRTKNMRSSKRSTWRRRYENLGYGIDLYLHKRKFAEQVDESGHSDRDIDYEIKRQKAIQKENCIRINPYEENFNKRKAIN